jgi:O-antigen/teichoic acid export membrane protein
VGFARKLFLMSALITALFWILPEEWVVGVLGSEWNDLMDYCRIISLWFGVWFIASSLSFIYMRLNKQGFMLIMDFIHLGMVIAGFFIGKAQGEVISALWGITIAQVLYYSIAIILALYFIRSSPLLKD